ncbi:MAG: hypothetical protein QW304_05555 [Thermoproteota archaeon]
MTLPYESRLGYRLPRFEISGGASTASEQDIAYSEGVFRSFLELEHSKLLIPPFCILNVFGGVTTLEAQKSAGIPLGAMVQVVPVDDVTVTLSGKPSDLLTVYSCEVHETTHMYQMSHLEVMNKYVTTEVLIYTFNSLLKAAAGQTAGSLELSEGKTARGLSFGNIEFRKLATDIKEVFPYLPLRIDRDKLVLLESYPLLVQMRSMEFPEVDVLKSSVEDRLRSNINTSVIKILGEDPSKSLYSEAMGLVYSLHEMLPKSYVTLLVYSNYLTGLGAQGLLEMAQKLVHDENKVRILVGVENEVESGGDPLTLAFDHDVFNYEDFVKHKENLLGTIGDALKICNSGKPFNRLNYIKKKIEGIKTPSELRYLAAGFSQNVFSQRLAVNQPPTYYLHANGVSYDKEEVMLFNSFFADLAITVNILKNLIDALEKGHDVRNTIKGSIRCPLKRAPQMRCASSFECEHEKNWLDTISGSG